MKDCQRGRAERRLLFSCCFPNKVRQHEFFGYNKSPLENENKEHLADSTTHLTYRPEHIVHGERR